MARKTAQSKLMAAIRSGKKIKGAQLALLKKNAAKARRARKR